MRMAGVNTITRRRVARGDSSCWLHVGLTFDGQGDGDTHLTTTAEVSSRAEHPAGGGSKSRPQDVGRMALWLDYGATVPLRVCLVLSTRAWPWLISTRSMVALSTDDLPGRKPGGRTHKVLREKSLKEGGGHADKGGNAVETDPHTRCCGGPDNDDQRETR